jgi:hypothetical protein
MKCLHCKNAFEGRSGAKYCSAKCRKSANRDKPVTDKPLSVTSVTDKSEADVTDKVVGPLDVYSKHQWGCLQSAGYVWDAVENRACHKVKKFIAVTVPGDPGYGEVEPGTCRSCGKETQQKNIVKCMDCVKNGWPTPEPDERFGPDEDGGLGAPQLIPDREALG